MPYLDTQYGVIAATECRPQILDILTTRPRDLFTNGKKVIVMSTSPNKLTSITCIQTGKTKCYHSHFRFHVPHACLHFLDDFSSMHLHLVLQNKYESSIFRFLSVYQSRRFNLLKPPLSHSLHSHNTLVQQSASWLESSHRTFQISYSHKATLWRFVANYQKLFLVFLKLSNILASEQTC